MSTALAIAGEMTEAPERVAPEVSDRTPVTRARRGAAHRHAEVRLLTMDERRNRALDILADGVLRLLTRDKVVEPALEPGDDPTRPALTFRRASAAGEAK